MNYDNLEVEINPEYTMMKKINRGLYLSQEQIDIIKMYDINPNNYTNLSSLINTLQEIYDDNEDDDMLGNLLDILQERNYYENYNK